MWAAVAFRRFSMPELRSFLEAIDSLLAENVRVVIIGGAAVGLGYWSAHSTSDLDLWDRPGQAFWRAVASLGQDDVPVQVAAIAEAPFNFEDRLVPLQPGGFKHLRVFLPEAHDLAMLKVARGHSHDLAAIEEIHRVHPLSLETLIERYRETLPQVMGPPERFRTSFLAMIERLFGPQVATLTEGSLLIKP